MARSMAYLGALVLAAAVASEGVPASTALRGQDHQVRDATAALSGGKRRLQWWCWFGCEDDDNGIDIDNDNDNDNDGCWFFCDDDDDTGDGDGGDGGEGGGGDGGEGGGGSSSDSIEPSTTDDDISQPYDDDGMMDDGVGDDGDDGGGDDGGGDDGGGDDGGGDDGGNTGATCSDYNGIASYDKNTCCMQPCGACGNSWCATIGGDGYGADACCASVIADSGVVCGPGQDAPCNLTPSAPGPTPTTPTSQPSPTPTPQPAATPTPQPVSGPTPAVPTTVPSPNYPFPTPPPTPVMTIPSSCPAGDVPPIRWAAGTSLGGRMYAEGEGCVTMTDLYKTRVTSDGWTAKGPIYVLDAETNDIILKPTKFTGRWLITSDLYITGGGIFYCIGTSAGGDCDELRIQSTGPTDFHQIRGHGGSLYFKSALVTSWDTPNKRPQEVHEGGRSFLNCVSEKLGDEDCIGKAKNQMGECRMDILDSEIGWLGWMDSESYGLTWKVRGFCVDKRNPEVFDTTNVYGDIMKSDIHHLYYGMYSYGLQGGIMTDNIMRDNWQYGFDPHDDSDYLIIANNDVYNNVNHGIIASKRCNHVDIYDNTVHDGGALAAGIFLHRSSNRAKVYGNTVYNMQDAGLAILESFDSEIYDNTFTNVKYGIRISLGGGNNEVYDNTFDNCSKYGLYTYEGSDVPEETPDGRPGENVFRNNKILNTSQGVKIKRADNTQIIDNVFTGTTLLEFNDAQATTWADNTLPSGVCLKNISGVDDEGLTVPESTFTSQTNGVPDPSNC